MNIKKNKTILTINDSIKEKLKKIINLNIIAKFVIITIIWIIALIPLWLYLLVRLMIDPFGFWQELALFCIFLISVGWLQGVTIFLGGSITFVILTDEL